MARSTLPERSSAFAAATEGSGTSLTESSFVVPAVCTTCSTCGDRPPTIPTVWMVGPALLLWRVGMMIAAATAIEDDEGADPEDAAPDALFDLAHRDHADVAQRVLEGAPSAGAVLARAGLGAGLLSGPTPLAASCAVSSDAGDSVASGRSRRVRRRRGTAMRTT